MHHRWILKRAFWGAFCLLNVVLFQNCGGSFQAIQPQEAQSLMPRDDFKLVKTQFYFGRTGGIDAIEIDHATSAVTVLPPTTFAGTQVGWMTYDSANHQVFAADSGVLARLERFAHQATTGTLTSVEALTDLGSIVHMLTVPITNGFRLFAASYNAGTISDRQLVNGQIINASTFTFPTGAKAHSSALDPIRNLLFVATLGLNKIQVFKVLDHSLTLVDEIPVIAPRTVVFDPTYDKLFVSTEASSGNSFIKGYSVTANATNTAYTFQEVASLAMSLTGADLKVNHAQNYVLATSREPGHQAINGMPVNKNGELDQTRPSFTIPLTQVQPRSLEVSADGRFVVVAMNSAGAENVLAFELLYDTESRFAEATLLFSQKISSSGYVCALSVPIVEIR